MHMLSIEYINESIMYIIHYILSIEPYQSSLNLIANFSHSLGWYDIIWLYKWLGMPFIMLKLLKKHLGDAHYICQYENTFVQITFFYGFI